MENSNKLQVFNLVNRTVLVDLESKCFISVNSKYYSKEKLDDPNSAISQALEKRRSMQPKINSSNLNSVYLFITEDCNLSCEFCCMRSNNHDENLIKNKLDFKNIEDTIPLLKKLNPRKLFISGGEPFTNKKLVPIVKILRNELQSKISIQSNGLLISEALISEIGGYIDSIEISTAHFKDFEKLETIIKEFKKHNIKISLSFIYNENIDQLYRIIDFVEEHKVTFALAFISKTGSAKDNGIRIISYMEKIDVFKKIAQYLIDKNYDEGKVAEILFKNMVIRDSCSALGNTLAIYPNGECYMCHSLNYPKFSPGNVLKELDSNIIANLESLTFKEEIKELFNVDNKKTCNCCKFKYFCSGFCGASIYHGDVTVDQCIIQKLFIIHALIHYNPKLSGVDNLKSFIALCNDIEQIKGA